MRTPFNASAPRSAARSQARISTRSRRAPLNVASLNSQRSKTTSVSAAPYRSHSVIRQSRKTTRSSCARRSPTRSRRQSTKVTSESFASASSTPVRRHPRSSTRRRTIPGACRFAQSRSVATASMRSPSSTGGAAPSATSGGYGETGGFPTRPRICGTDRTISAGDRERMRDDDNSPPPRMGARTRRIAPAAPGAKAHRP
jgi:hypothetical protein